MKKSILIAVSLLSLSSCTKYYECRCMDTVNNTFQGSYSSKDKADVERDCEWEKTNPASAHANNPNITCTVQKEK